MKNIATLLLSLLAGVSAWAQFAEPVQISPVSKGLSSTESGDMDGDGDLDVVVSSFKDGKVVWYENDGAGFFIDHHTILDTDEAYRLITVYDFDYNGYADIVTAANSNGDPETRLWLNLGQGNGPPIVLNMPAGYTSINSIFSFDMNLDGYADIVLSAGAGMGCWMKNNGSGQFTETVEIVIPNGGDIDNLFDFNGDSLIDVFVKQSTEEETCLVNDSAGYVFHSLSLPYNIETVYGSGDMDNDGDLDLVARGFQAGTSEPILWLENDGADQFTSHTLIASSANNGQGVKVIDLDGQPGPEVVVPRGGLRLYHGANTNYTMLTELVAPLKNLQFEDFNGDGIVDILFDHGLVVLFGDSTYQDWTEGSHMNTPGGCRQMVLTDVNKDGYKDILAVSSTGFQYQVEYLKYTGNDQYANSSYAIDLSSGSVMDVYSRDLDNNGTADVGYVGWDGKITTSENDGSGNFSIPEVHLEFPTQQF
ncbi:MAG: hypothetical protein GC178_00455 [Flavobacteriales bacterium]|nr:hypothetical protein [Flavobacteriales bacterium]